MRNSQWDSQQMWAIDSDFGFRPVLGNSEYNVYGTLYNNYSFEKKENTKRLLFLGDSVTRRAKIIDALRESYGEEKFEYFNAGVESFNTVQEVAFYKKYNSVIRPDHLILTLHNNDFETTPVAFYNQDHHLVIYAPGTTESSPKLVEIFHGSEVHVRRPSWS